MKLFGKSLDWNFPIWTRDREGTNFYDITSAQDWFKNNSNLGIAQSHALLTPALLFVSKLFSQAEFKLVRKSSGEEVTSHPILSLLKRPNYTQTLSDFLESLMFSEIANGTGVIYTKKVFGTDNIQGLYVLDYSLIEFPDSLKKGKFKNKASWDKALKVTVKYDRNGEDLDIKLSDLLFLYDLPNSLGDNLFEAKSRIDGLKQTLINTVDSTIAKNIIIRSNGKELITGESSGFPLSPDEKEKVEQTFNNNYGLSWSRKRGIVTKANIKWQSLATIMRDLGHDESTRTDSTVIFAALHLPSDVYSITGAKSTYKNANASMISYVQNELMPTLASFIETISKIVPDNLELQGSYDHLPVMLPSITVKYQNVSLQMKALNDARMTGIPDDVALEMVGLPKRTKLNPVMPLSGGNGLAEQPEEPSNDGEETKLISLVQ